ncbi:3-hydroxyisobutyrate dehydrogenase [Lentibacillus kapialis]|uniref:3-hydroxyisobutyrate dehydrogenase n=1 Tax=Lentibacillus kapialis TaxID=340214 RepID=A0A917Q0J5_9BACI|nr:NAD(P)-dependent oxidoreductase [Lentibacillus kapialis]GGK03434.1 3-hydroxyisobutyrate dehydrogenase [Lentibacillus kapialis]
MIKTVGVIGLGNMGSSIARGLSESFKVIGFDIDDDKRSSLLQKHGIECIDQLELLVKKVDVIVLSLPNGKISKEVVSDMVSHMDEKKIIMETSTVLPTDISDMLKICEMKGVEIVDAAILGGVNHVLESNAEFLVGGNVEIIDRVKPILNKLGKKVTRMGEIGSGMSAKVISNAVSHTVMVLITESIALGRKSGISHEKMYALLNGETTYNRPIDHRFNERIANGEYSGGMSTLNARKDSTLMLELAQQFKIPLFTIQSSHTVYEIAQNEGYGELDYAAIAILWEKWCDISLKRESSEEGRYETI